MLLLDVGGQNVKDLLVNGVKLRRINKNERFIEIPKQYIQRAQNQLFISF